MFNNVTYQAATDGRAFQLIPLILISLVRSSTARLLVHLRHWHQHRPIIATNVAPGCIGWNTPTSVPVLVCPTCQRTISFHIVEVAGFEPAVFLWSANHHILLIAIRHLESLRHSATPPIMSILISSLSSLLKTSELLSGLVTVLILKNLNK